MQIRELTILSKCSSTESWSFELTSASSFNTTYKYQLWDLLTNIRSIKYEKDMPQHIQKVWQISEVFWLACTDFPVYETCKDSENTASTWNTRVLSTWNMREFYLERRPWFLTKEHALVLLHHQSGTSRLMNLVVWCGNPFQGPPVDSIYTYECMTSFFP